MMKRVSSQIDPMGNLLRSLSRANAAKAAAAPATEEVKLVNDIVVWLKSDSLITLEMHSLHSRDLQLSNFDGNKGGFSKVSPCGGKS